MGLFEGGQILRITLTCRVGKPEHNAKLSTLAESLSEKEVVYHTKPSTVI